MGRFAPTPSGNLHLGSLYAAAAGYLDARAHGGQWRLRIEDLDKPREVPGSADGILRTLERYGFEWDGPVERQSERTHLYEDALRSLASRGLTYPCCCSRQQLDDGRYPGTCRDGAVAVADAMTATRVRIESAPITFTDRIQGTYRQDVAAAVGDFILKRRDQIIAYVLAVVIDDAAQGITHIVRGADLLDNTPRQIALQRLLGLGAPAYAHVAVLTEPDGTKLAKSRRTLPLDAAPLRPLLTVFGLLGLAPPACLEEASPAEAFAWGIARWRIETAPRRLSLPVNY